uniref:DB domain-containing protein n=1 Tax=Ascaris lumbricoides TaxID=6252 RepID=A0A0M3IKW7_ASCLU
MAFYGVLTQEVAKCPRIPLEECCRIRWSTECVPKYCFKYVMAHCPDRKMLMFSRTMKTRTDIRRAPSNIFVKTEEIPKCGTAEANYEPCTSKTVANKLFLSCCKLYVPPECHSMCVYETDQRIARAMLVEMIEENKCNIRYLSGILYCASQNRDNRKCCADLDLNAPQLQVGSRCLRMCDPSGTAIEKLAKEDATCLFNWNVIMYCHHSGIREM